jgi:hypothetical protein
MTVPEKKQLENVNLALRALMAELNSGAISATFFDPKSSSFKEVLQTTWKELIDQGWLEGLELYGRVHFRLTGSGWVEGLYRTDAATDPRLTGNLAVLAAVLKGYVKGRDSDAIVEFSTLLRDSSLPSGWVFNAIDSNLFEKLWRRRGAHWGERGILVAVPLNFGLKLIDHAADIRAQLDETQEELEQAKQELEELSEYRCSICKAPVVYQDYNVPLSEHVDGYVVRYACGRVDTDGYGTQPCPSDPKFPKLEDYELRLEEKAGESYFKWSCRAEPKTAQAKQVSIQRGLGRTAEEARQQVIDNYQRNSRPWKG